MNNQNLTPAEKISKAKIKLITGTPPQPFFACLMIRLSFKEDKTCPTMSTDGKSIFWSAKFVETLEIEEITGVIAHEILHCAFLHFARMKGRNHKLWNIACDLAINPILLEAGFKLPNGCLNDYKYHGQSAEEIYSALQDTKEEDLPKGNRPGEVYPPQNESGDEGNEPGEETGESAGNALKKEWTIATVQASILAKKQDKMPAGLKRLINESLEPKVSWKSILRELLQNLRKDDYSWSRPNRRMLGSGFILPSLHSESTPPIVVAVDTSGSINERILNEFLSEIESIASELKPEKIILMDCDTEVHNIWELEPGDDIPRKFTGGGGTDLTNIFTKLEEFGDNIACIIILTDLETPFPLTEPFPIIWATKSNLIAPIGTTIKIE